MTALSPVHEGGRYWPDPLFVGVLVGREREGRTLSVVAQDITVFSPRYRLRIPIPAGYVTDFASIPQFAQVRIQPYGRHVWAALVHDWLYSVGEPGQRELADAIFLEKLEDASVSPIRRTVMYRSVRLGGGRGYANAQRDWVVSFADRLTGERRPPPFPRESAFCGQPNGPAKWSPG